MTNPDHDEFVQDNPLAAATGQTLNETSNNSGSHLTAGAGETWKERTAAARERTETFVRENPVPIIVGALVLGLAAGWALRYATHEEEEVHAKTPLGDLNWSFLSLPFLWPFFKSVKEKYEDSADVIKDSVRDGVGRMRKLDVGDYTKPLRKRWKSWTR